MFINVHITKCSFCSGLQVFRWCGKKGTQDDLGQVPLAGPTVLLDTLQIDLKMSPRQGIHTGDVVVEIVIGLTQSQYCYARRAHLTPMPLVPRSLIGCQKCDSGSLHCPRYTGELTSQLCWAWLDECWEHAQGLL